MIVTRLHCVSRELFHWLQKTTEELQRTIKELESRQAINGGSRKGSGAGGGLGEMSGVMTQSKANIVSKELINTKFK